MPGVITTRPFSPLVADRYSNCTSSALAPLGTSTWNACWYRYGEVCSGWSYWSVNGVSKTCYGGCDAYGNTTGMILYGFENYERIRGRFTVGSGKFYMSPSGLDMGGYLRAQVTWWSGVSQINAAAIG